MEREKQHLLPLPTRFAIAIASIVFATSCVSVNIGPKGAQKSEGVTYNSPGSPFKQLENARADGAWLNSDNGNSISYLSTCNDPADPSLETAAREMVADLKDLQTIKSEVTTFNGREALDNEVEGKVEGVSTRIRSMIFKKNGCLYTISMVGITKTFDQDRSRFAEFLKGFRAP